MKTMFGTLENHDYRLPVILRIQLLFSFTCMFIKLDLLMLIVKKKGFDFSKQQLSFWVCNGCEATQHIIQSGGLLVSNFKATVLIYFIGRD